MILFFEDSEYAAGSVTRSNRHRNVVILAATHAHFLHTDTGTQQSRGGGALD